MLTIFIIRGLRVENNIINLRLFKNKTFASANAIGSLFAISILGMLSIIPIMLENLFNYPADTAGLIMAPRGITSAVGMAIVAQLINRVDSRYLMFAGIVITGIGTYPMIHFNLNTSIYLLVVTAMVQGFGMGLTFVPLSTLALSHLSKEDTAEGSGLFSFTRSLGNSIGISILSTILVTQTQVNWNRLGGHLQWGNYNFTNWLQAHHLNLYDPQTLKILAMELYRQASMIAFLDTFKASLLGILLMLPFVLLMTRPKPA